MIRLSKKMNLRLIMVMLICVICLTPVYAAEQMKVVINGVTIKFDLAQPQVVNGVTYVPLRGVFEELGFKVKWDQTNKTVILVGNGQEIKISADSSYVINGEKKRLSNALLKRNSSTLLPLREIGSLVGAETVWDAVSKTIYIQKQIIQNKEVTFEDINFEKGIRALINKPEGTIYTRDLMEIDKLEVFGEYWWKNQNKDYVYINYEEAWIEINGDREKNGQEKYLNQMSTEELTKQGIYKAGYIQSIDDLAKLPCLKQISLSYLPKADVKEFEKLNKVSTLEKIYISDRYKNKTLPDFSGLENLTTLSYFIGQENDGFRLDISNLKTMPNLKHLRLSIPKVEGFEAISTLDQLEIMYLYTQTVFDGKYLDGKNELISFTINSTQYLKNQEIIKALPKLEEFIVRQ